MFSQAIKPIQALPRISQVSLGPDGTKVQVLEASLEWQEALIEEAVERFEDNPTPGTSGDGTLGRWPGCHAEAMVKPW
jgi:hypothetical protein